MSHIIPPVPYISYVPPRPLAKSRSVPPYVSQISDAPRRNDCGPACALMLARWVGKGLKDSVTAWADAIDAAHDGTTAADLASMLRQLGLTPATGASVQYPRIELVRYNKLPKQNPAFAGGTFLHWIVRTSDTTYHDPLWTGAQGAGLSATKESIDAALYDAVSSVGIVERPNMSYQARTPYERVIHVMSQNATREEYLYVADIAYKAKQSIAFSWDDAALPIEGLKSRTIIAWNIPTVQQNAYVDFVNRYYGAASIPTTIKFQSTSVSNPPPVTPPVTQPTQPAQPTSPATPAALLGVHELGLAGKAREALQRGAGAVMCFEDALGAAQLSLAYPDAIVMHRKYFNHPIAPADLIAQHGIDPNAVSASRAWYRGTNENDVTGYDSSPDGIRRRAAWDIECAKILKHAAPNAKWIGGGFAHGNPDFTSGAVCDAMREGYAAAYNSGLMLFDIHNYSKSNPNNPKDYRYYAPIWFERRWQFLFERCGFDPRVRGIVATEAGIEAGAGGFRWAGFTPDEFRAWCAYQLKVQQQPLVVSGQQYPSPYLAGTLFQWGNNYQGSGGWWGYGLDEYVSVLEAAWRGQLPAEKSLAAVDVHAGALVPDGYEPPAKDFSHFLT